MRRSLVGWALILCVRVMAMPGGFEQADTTPPVLHTPLPAPDSTVAEEVRVGASYADGLSGIDRGSARLLLDGRDLTGQAEVSDTGIFLTLRNPAAGYHRAEVTVCDRAGNQANRLVWRFGVGASEPISSRLAGGRFLVNDEPFFPLCLYNLHTNPDSDLFDEAVLRQAAVAGFNGLDGGAGSQRGLDTALRHGMRQFLSVFGGVYSRCTDPQQAREALLDGPLQWRRHPAVIGYWADAPDSVLESDTKLSREEAVRRLQVLRDVLRQEDPLHVAAWCLSHKDTFADYLPPSDALKTFFYPIRPGGSSVASVADVMVLPAVQVAGDKPVWFTSQAFDFVFQNTGHKPEPRHLRPTIAELRAMNYLALISGARQLTIYSSGSTVTPGVYNDVTQFPEHWAALLALATEIRYLSPLLAAGRIVPTVGRDTQMDVSFEGTAPVRRVSAEQGNIRYAQWECQGQQTLVAVNVTEFTAYTTWHFATPTRLRVLFEDRILSQPARAVPDEFPPFAVHIYQWGSQ